MEILSNILTSKETKKVIEYVLTDITERISCSVGPYGSTTIIEDPFVNHTITKDGYSILKKIMYNDEVAMTILDIIKKISRSLVREVGDGSTSSIIIASKLYKTITELNNNISPKIIIKILKVYENILEREIRNMAIDITDNNFEKITEIATISNNNDVTLGKLISDLYRKIGSDGFITLENSKTSEDHYIITDGYEIERGYISNMFSNKANKIDCELESPFIFIANDTLRENDLTYLQDLLGVICGRLKSSVVIIAKDYTPEVFNFLKINKTKNIDFQFAAIDFSLANRNGVESLDDFAIYTGTTIYDNLNDAIPEEFNLNLLGRCEKAVINERTSKFVKGNGDKNIIKERIEYLEKEIEDLKIKDERVDSDKDIFRIQKRISLLSSKTATFYVGGNSEIEKENRKFLLEDSILACQSTLKNGYIIGGNLIIPMILRTKGKDIFKEVKDTLKNDLIDDSLIERIQKSIENSFLSGFSRVLRNYKNDDVFITDTIEKCLATDSIYNLTNFKYEDKENTTVINSAATDIEIMKATFSIIGLLATSNQFISRAIKRENYI